MNPQNDPTPVIPVATPVLSYSQPVRRVGWPLLAGLGAVAMFDLLFGALLLFLSFAKATLFAALPVWMIFVGVMACVTSAAIWTRTPTGWRCAVVLLLTDSAILSLMGLVATFRLWDGRGAIQSEGVFLNVFFGNLMGSLNLLGVYVLCRAKRAFQLDQLDTRWLQRTGLIFPMPIAVFFCSVYVLAKYY